MNWIPVVSTTVTFAFTIAVFIRYRSRGGIHLLLWAFGLALYAVGTLSEAILSLTFSPWILRIWYLSGAMLTAAWLGQGTVHLLVKKGRIAQIASVILALVSVLATVLILVAPVTTPSSFQVSQPVSSQYDEILTRSGTIVLMTIILNIYGTITLVGGAIYSSLIFWRKRVLANRMHGNLLIAAGALFPALGGTFIRLGLADWLYLSELVGAVLMYAGFLRATTPARVESPAVRGATPEIG